MDIVGKWLVSPDFEMGGSLAKKKSGVTLQPRHF